jgi:ABC-type multidrug transport system fused ATPase/permease subunit
MKRRSVSAGSVLSGGQTQRIRQLARALFRKPRYTDDSPEATSALDTESEARYPGRNLDQVSQRNRTTLIIAPPVEYVCERRT